MHLVLFHEIKYTGELHGGALGGQFSEAKTLGLVKASFFWPKLERDITRFVKKCVVCKTREIFKFKFLDKRGQNDNLPK